MATGQYKISAAFEERIHDINSWTMAPDFYTRWPELLCDIPMFCSVPAPVSSPLSSPNNALIPRMKTRFWIPEQEEERHREVSIPLSPKSLDTLTTPFAASQSPIDKLGFIIPADQDDFDNLFDDSPS